MTWFRLCEISHGSFEPLQCFPTRQARDCQPSLLAFNSLLSGRHGAFASSRLRRPGHRCDLVSKHQNGALRDDLISQCHKDWLASLDKNPKPLLQNLEVQSGVKRLGTSAAAAALAFVFEAYGGVGGPGPSTRGFYAAALTQFWLEETIAVGKILRYAKCAEQSRRARAGIPSELCRPFNSAVGRTRGSSDACEFSPSVMVFVSQTRGRRLGS